MPAAISPHSELEQQIAAAKRMKAILKSRESLLDFLCFINPDPEAPEDPERSAFQRTPVARLLCDLVEKMERGDLLRACVSCPPQHGKSDVISRGGIAWKAGRNPKKHRMLGTYSQDFAEEFGSDVRNIMLSPEFKQVFPQFALRKGSKAKDTLVTTKGGKLNFLGRGGAGTGKTSDDSTIDDPIKDDAEAQSPTVRQTAWSWFTKVIMSRIRKFSSVLIVHTRWSEDDMIGRLVDKDHPDHDPDIAKDWTYINIPAVITDPALAKALGLELLRPHEYAEKVRREGREPDSERAHELAKETAERIIKQFGDKPMCALWEEDKPLSFLAAACQLDKKGFWALYMGQPAPEDGDFFKKADFEAAAYHSMSQFPTNVRWYAASDHALTTDEANDSNCCGAFALDEHDDIWIPPDIFWERVETDELVRAMLLIMKTHKPLVWWAEDEHIRKSIGPFLRKEMMDKKIYCAIDPILPGRRDLKSRARAIQGRTQQRRVHLPKFASWYQPAMNELMKFPNAAHDDFVSFLALIGLGLLKEVPASAEAPPERKHASGTMGWMRERMKWQDARGRHLKLVSGM